MGFDPSTFPSALIWTEPATAAGEAILRSTGNCSPVNATVGTVTDSRRKLGSGRPASATVSIGMPRRWACQAARVMLPAFSLPSEIKTILGTRSDGSELMASSIPDSRSVARPASPEVGSRCRPRCSPAARSRTERANGRTRTQWRPRALSRAPANSEARARSWGETLEDVSTKTATAIFVWGVVSVGSARASYDGEE